MSNVAVQLPQWQSHKKVWGDKIIEVRTQGENEESEILNDSGFRWMLACGAYVPVSYDLLRRVPENTDPVGGYYVQYKDGFQSWSPAQAFEEGYTRI